MTCTRASRRPVTKLLAAADFGIFAPFLAVIAFGACDSASPPDYSDLAGTYVGTMEGSGSNAQLYADVDLSVEQAGGGLSGKWSMMAEIWTYGNLYRLSSVLDFTGAVEQGGNPRLLITLDEPCGGTLDYSGTYRTAGSVLELSGDIELLWMCEPVDILTLSARLAK